MDNAKFWELYDSGKLENVKHWIRKDAEDIAHCSEITSFTYNGRFYLRICEFKGYYGYWTGKGASRHFEADRNATRRNTYIKEFNNKNAANAYFKKCAADYTPYDPSKYIK